MTRYLISREDAVNANGDLIYRADAIEAIQNAYCKPCKERGDDHNEVRCRACDYDNAIIQIDALPSAEAVDVYKAHEEEHLNIINRIKELQYAIAKTQTIVGKMVESAEAEWIPCSDRLPGENETVLISAKYIGHLSKNSPYVEEGFLTRDGWYSAYGDNYSELLAEVVAWMPLPTPYKGGDTE